MADIQSTTAEIRRGKKRKKKPQDKNIMSASATQGGHKNLGIVLMTTNHVRYAKCLAALYWQYSASYGENDNVEQVNFKTWDGILNVVIYVNAVRIKIPDKGDVTNLMKWTESLIPQTDRRGTYRNERETYWMMVEREKQRMMSKWSLASLEARRIDTRERRRSMSETERWWPLSETSWATWGSWEEINFADTN